jgi:uncharacterized C2H2 Zn-finger protein
MVYENCKIYGPYTRKQDGRKHVVVIYPDGKHGSVSYPKFLTEKRLGRYLEDNETVDHLDTDINNNAPENLVVKERKAHIIEDVKRCAEQTFKCPQCGIQFSRSGKKLHWVISARNNKDKAGPFCSRSCAGKYGKEIQMATRKPLEVKRIEPEYTTRKLSLRKETSEVDAAKTGKP